MPVLSQAALEKRLTTDARLTADVKDTTTAVRLIQTQADPSDSGRTVTLTPGRVAIVRESQR
jgi:hypothetical protein